MQGLISKELKSPPHQSVQHSSAGIREQSNPRGKSEGGGLLSYLSRGRLPSMGQGTPSVAPNQAKGAVPRPPSVSTPPRSRSAERPGGTSTPRTETPPRSRSAERSDSRDGGTPTHQSAQTATSWLDGPKRQSSTEPPRELPTNPEGLGSIVIGGNDQPPSDPPQEEENRSSPMGVIGRALSVFGSMGRGPRPERGRSSERAPPEASRSPSGGSDGDSSSYGSDVRVHMNPVAQEPRVPATQRPEVPMPPAFREEDVFMAGFQMGAAVQAQQEENDRLRAQLSGISAPIPPARDQPPEEPDPELPGAGEPPSEQPTDAGSTEVIEDDSDAETLRFHDAEDRSDHPETTDNDPYEDAEQQEDLEPETDDPDGSQAEARADPDITYIDVDEPPKEAKDSDIPERPSQEEETPVAAIEAPVAPPSESVETKEKRSGSRKPHEFTGSIADWAKLVKSSPAEPKHGKSPPKESLTKSGEHSPPEAPPAEAASSKEDKEHSSKPTQGEDESASASQAPPAETAASASEGPKPASSEQQSSESNPLRELELRKIHRRRKPIQKPRQETEEEKAERERLEKIADDAAKKSAAELIAQEQDEKQKLSDKEARSKQAAAANTEKAREAADKAKKKKEADKADEKVPRSVARRMKKAPEKEDGDPPDDPTPWTVFRYRQPRRVIAGYTYEGVAITNKMNVIDPQYTVNTKAAHLGKGKLVTPIKEVLFLQGRQAYAGAKHRIRDIRSVQIERTFTNTVTLFPSGHMCNSKDGKSVVMRVTTPYSTEGELLLRTLPGEAPTRYTLKNALQIHHLKLEADFKDNRQITPLAHCVLHFATRALGYKLKDGKVGDRPAWFTPGLESR